MKNFKTISFAFNFLLMGMTVFANTDDATPISGRYDGTLETKTFLESRDDTRTSSTSDYNVNLMFNGNVFIYQGVDTKAMGTYELSGDKITFTVDSFKGDEDLVRSIFNKEYRYSKSGDQLMLIGNSEGNNDTMVYRLTKQNE